MADAPGVGHRGALARTPADAVFGHLVRVWRDPATGRVCGEWFDNGGTLDKYGPVAGLLVARPSRDGVWRRFDTRTSDRIPAALLEQALEQERERRAA